MDKKDYLPYMNDICACPLFSGLEDEEIFKFLDCPSTRVVKYKPGMLLDPGFLYVVLQGCIVIEKQASDGRFVTLGRAEPHAAVNAASVFLKGESLSRLMAQEESVLLSVSESCLREAIYRGGTFAINMTEFLASRVSFLNRKITSFAGYSAYSRLHMYLEENNIGGQVIIPMSMTEFAEFLGVGRASLYRTLDQMEREGKIERAGRKIIIRESEGQVP